MLIMRCIPAYLWVLLAGFVLATRGHSEPPAPEELTVELGTPPTAPPSPKTEAPMMAAAQTSFANFLQTASREVSRQFYNLVFGASENVSIDWSGNFATCAPGTNSTAYLQAVLRRVNYFRAMAGIPAAISFNNEYSRKAQAAALIMGANNKLNHYPSNYTCYSDDGFEAAGKSNLSLGNAGPQAVVSQIRDNGTNNPAAGHRRWILYPQTQQMGSGNVAGSSPYNFADALWVIDPFYGTTRPATRDNFVSWPPPGFVPYPVVYARWSFSYPGADFSASVVSMTSNSVPMVVSRETVASGFGENTLVWVPAGLDPNSLSSLSKPSTDTVYRVTLLNVLISGLLQSFSYDVTVFDPAAPGGDFHPPAISGPTNPIMLATNVYSFTAVSNANNYERRQSRLAALNLTDGAENGLTNFTVQAATNLYSVSDPMVHFTGSYSFHLTHTQAVRQVLTLNRVLLASSNSTVSFQSRLAYSTSSQIARVQVSTDEGSSWTDVYTQPGSNGAGESVFNLRTASLGSYAGRTVRLRLNYDIQSGTYYPQAAQGVGWYIDDLTLSNFQEVLSSSIAAVNSNRTFSFSPTNSGAFLLEIRPLFFGDYPAEWGPSLTVNAAPNVRISNIQKASGSTWNINFSVQAGSPSGFELWSAGTLTNNFAKEASAMIQTIVPGSQYRAVVDAAESQKFFRIRPL